MVARGAPGSMKSPKSAANTAAMTAPAKYPAARNTLMKISCAGNTQVVKSKLKQKVVTNIYTTYKN